MLLSFGHEAADTDALVVLVGLAGNGDPVLNERLFGIGHASSIEAGASADAPPQADPGAPAGGL